MAASATSAIAAEIEIIKEILTEDICLIEELLSLFERAPTVILIFLSRFQTCQRFAVKILTATNSAYGVLFIARLLFCPEAMDYDRVFYCERVAFVFATLFYCFKFSIFWKIAAALYVFTNFLLIKSLFEQNSSGHGEISESDRDEDEPELENEPPEKEEFELQNPETMKETDGKLGGELQKINRVGSDNKGSDMSYELVSDQESNDGQKAKEKKVKAKSYKEALMSGLGDLNDYKELCAILEKQKRGLALKLHATTGFLNKYRELYHSIQREYLDYQIMHDQERRDLVAKFVEEVEALNGYQGTAHEHLVSNNDFAANATAATDEFSKQLLANLVSARASQCEYQKRYEDAVNDLHEKRQKWEQERNELNGKLTAISSWYEYYVLASNDYQLQNHNLIEERNELSVKLHSANSSTEFYKACFDDAYDECRKAREENVNVSAKLFAETSSAEHYRNLLQDMEEKNRKLEEEKNELVSKLSAAKAASALYRSYLHDVCS